MCEHSGVRETVNEHHLNLSCPQIDSVEYEGDVGIHNDRSWEAK